MSLQGFPTLLSAAERRRERRAEVRRRYSLEKARARCACCGLDGGEHPECIDFHHPFPQRKRASIADMVSRGCAWSTIYRELVTTVPLCSNCHRKQHAP